MRAIALCATLLLGAAAEGEAQVRAAVPRDGTVAVHTTSGSVRVVGWSRAEVSVAAEDEAGTGAARIVRQGATTTVRGPDGADLEVSVPAGSRVVVKTRSGGIAVEGVTGALDLESTSGSFHVGGTPRMVTVEGISGNVEVAGTTETLRVWTVSGDVHVPRAQGFVEASSISGNVEVVGRGLRRATLRSTSGRTSFAGSVPRDGSVHLENTSGIVELRVPAGIAADFDLTSLANGEIESDLGPRVERRSGPAGMAALRFSNGSGGAEITARTVSGVIRLKTQ